MGEQVHATSAGSAPALLPARAVKTAFSGLQEEMESSEQGSLCCSLQRLVLKDRPCSRVVERQVSCLSPQTGPGSCHEFKAHRGQSSSPTGLESSG